MQCECWARGLCLGFFSRILLRWDSTHHGNQVAATRVTTSSIVSEIIQVDVHWLRAPQAAAVAPTRSTQIRKWANDHRFCIGVFTAFREFCRWVLSLSFFSINFRIVLKRFSVTPPNNAQLISLPFEVVLWSYGECVHGCGNRWLMVAMIPTINRNESCIIMQQRFIETTWINKTH